MAIRRRSLTVSLAVVAAVAVTAMLAGTLAVAWAMFLSSHDLGVVTTVVAMAAVVSLATALLLGRWAGGLQQGAHPRRALLRRRRRLRGPRRRGDRRTRRAEPELQATSAKLAESRDRERALESSRRELVAWISHDLRTPLAWICGRCRRRW